MAASLFRAFAEYVALGCQLISVALVAVGAVEAVGMLLRHFRQWSDVRFKKRLWVRFATWILLALELNLAADIVATAISPTWNDIGQLAAIAAIRTFLSFFLGRDLDELAPQASSPRGRQGFAQR
jgi:uncharacterized membrane protein